MSEIEELRLAYAECSRQRNELLTAHKLSAEKIRVLRDALVKVMNYANCEYDSPAREHFMHVVEQARAALEKTK